MDHDSDNRRLFREAADLAIRLQDDPANPELIRQVRDWIARGPDHRTAWGQVSAIHGMTGKLLAGQQDAGVNRRQLILGGLAGLGLAAAAAAQGQRLWMRARADYLTARADTRQIALADGSRMMLGPDSAVAVHMGTNTREVELLRGMAFFDIATRTPRDFAVRAGPSLIEGHDSGFDVSLDADALSVAVRRGAVRVNDGTLAAGDWLRLRPGSAAATRGHRDPAQVAVWRQGMLVAEEETVAVVVSRIARWHRSRVMIVDSDLGQRVVSGVFDLGDSAAALQAAVQPFGGRVRDMGPFLTVIT